VSALAHVAARANLLLDAADLTLTLFGALANYQGRGVVGSRSADLEV
jgi:hypothetical protein